MNILIGCEESQVVCKAFRAKGHNAFSCDLKPCSGRHPEWHIQMDVLNTLTPRTWDLIILHPDCTAMAVSGNAHYGHGKPLHYKRAESVTWTKHLWQKAISVCDHVCLENPVSVIFQHLTGGNKQYIQPWQFGHGETKKTGLYLRNLPKLTPTNIVSGREQRIFKMAPSADRKRLRSITYAGIAQAMAEQWSNIL